MLQGHEYGASVLHGMHVYSPAFASTKLYCLVTEAHRCEKLAQSFYAETRTRDLLIASPTLYRNTTTPLPGVPKIIIIIVVRLFHMCQIVWF